MHFWCRLFPMSTDGQAWRWRTKRSWCKLQSISPPNDSLQGLQPAVTSAEREEWEGIVAPAVDAPQPQQLITGWLSRALSLCWHPPVWGLRGVTSVTMCSAFVLCGNKTVLHASNLRIVVFISQCLMTPFCRSWSIDGTLNRFSTLSTLTPSEWFLIATLNDMFLMSCKSHVLVGWSRHKRSNTLRKT